jgi:hypothetical protein
MRASRARAAGAESRSEAARAEGRKDNMLVT